MNQFWNKIILLDYFTILRCLCRFHVYKMRLTDIITLIQSQSYLAAIGRSEIMMIGSQRINPHSSLSEFLLAFCIESSRGDRIRCKQFVQKLLIYMY